MISNYKTYYKNFHKSINIDQVSASLEEDK
jgi:hypothetical protein